MVGGGGGGGGGAARVEWAVLAGSKVKYSVILALQQVSWVGRPLGWPRETDRPTDRLDDIWLSYIAPPKESAAVAEVAEEGGSQDGRSSI